MSSPTTAQPPYMTPTGAHWAPRRGGLGGRDSSRSGDGWGPGCPGPCRRGEEGGGTCGVDALEARLLVDARPDHVPALYGGRRGEGTRDQPWRLVDRGGGRSGGTQDRAGGGGTFGRLEVPQHQAEGHPRGARQNQRLGGGEPVDGRGGSGTKANPLISSGESVRGRRG